MFFEVEQSSIRDLLSKSDRGYCIPSFQRPFTWDASHIGRLFVDVEALVESSLCNNEGASDEAFLGSAIFVEDKKNSEIPSGEVADAPDHTQIIVDGQQRLSIYMIISISLHEKLSSCLNDAYESEFSDSEIKKNYIKLVRQHLSKLENMMYLDMGDVSDHCRYYPRVISSNSDNWSTEESKCVYSSPISKFVWQYICKIKDCTDEICPCSESEAEITQAHKNVQKAKEFIVNFVDKLLLDMTKFDSNSTTGNVPKALYPKQASYTDKINMFSDLLSSVNIYGEIADFFKENKFHPDRDKREKFMDEGLAAIALAKIIFDRMLIVVVQVTNISDGFNIFDALNTTGEPLTAIETFKADVIRKIGGSANYQSSEHKKHFDKAEEYLGKAKNAEEKQKITFDFVISYVLSEAGVQVPKKLNKQRSKLAELLSTKTDESLGSTERPPVEIENDLVDFTRRLSFLASFMNHEWTGTPRVYEDLLNYSDEEIVSIKFLRDLDHTIVIPPLSRFFSKIQRSTNDFSEFEVQKNVLQSYIDEYKQALLATAAFSAIWRSAYGVTDDIAHLYVSTMDEYLSVKAKNSKDISVVAYKKMLFRFLEDRGLHKYDLWITHSRRIPIYRNARAVAKFMLYLAADNTVEFDGPGSEQASYLKYDAQSDNALTNKCWLKKYEVEHIAIRQYRNNNKRWDGEQYDPIYDAYDVVVNYLGNLLILPKEVNKKLRELTWPEKRIAYALLGKSRASGARGHNQSNLIISEIVDKTLSKKEKQTLKTVQQCKVVRTLCKAVSSESPDWLKENIERRTISLLKYAWKRMEPWLIKSDE